MPVHCFVSFVLPKFTPSPLGPCYLLFRVKLKECQLYVHAYNR